MKRLLACIMTIMFLISMFSIAMATDIPGGRYKIGEDIPAGAYSITVKKGSTNLTVWGSRYEDFSADGGLLLNTVINRKNPTLGKVILNTGNVIDFSTALTFEKYKVTKRNWEQANTIPGGRYTVGEDIPAGSYNVSIKDGSTNLTVWGYAYEDFRTDGGLLLNVVVSKRSNPELGKVLLEEGNVIDFDSPLVFAPFKGFSFD